jgi:hypothetical protein
MGLGFSWAANHPVHQDGGGTGRWFGWTLAKAVMNRGGLMATG